MYAQVMVLYFLLKEKLQRATCRCIYVNMHGHIHIYTYIANCSRLSTFDGTLVIHKVNEKGEVYINLCNDILYSITSFTN